MNIASQLGIQLGQVLLTMPVRISAKLAPEKLLSIVEDPVRQYLPYAEGSEACANVAALIAQARDSEQETPTLDRVDQAFRDLSRELVEPLRTTDPDTAKALDYQYRHWSKFSTVQSSRPMAPAYFSERPASLHSVIPPSGNVPLIPIAGEEIVIPVLSYLIEKQHIPMGAFKIQSESLKDVDIFVINRAMRDASGHDVRSISTVELIMHFHEEDRAQFVELMREVQKNHFGQIPEIRVIDAQNVTRYVELTVQLLPGLQMGFFSLIDHTERKLAADEAEILTSVVRDSDDLLSLVALPESDGPRFVFSSRGFLDFFDVNADSGVHWRRSLRHYFPPGTRRRRLREIRDAMESGSVELQGVPMSAKGEIHRFDISGSAVGLANGRFALVRFSDAEKRFLEQQRAIFFHRMKLGEQITSFVSHEFNNALLVIIMYCQKFLKYLGEGKTVGVGEYEDAFNVLLETATRMKNDLHQLRGLMSRDDSTTPYSLHDLVSDHMVRLLLGGNISAKLELVESPWLVRGPSKYMAQVILNLCKNSGQAMRKSVKRELYVSTDKIAVTKDNIALLNVHPAFDLPSPGNYMRLRIQDTGTGIAPDLLPRIFDANVSTGELHSYTNPNGSSGLGLSIVRQIVADELGGFVAVVSEPGQGTTMDVYLPEAKSDSEKSEDD